MPGQHPPPRQSHPAGPAAGGPAIGGSGQFRERDLWPDMAWPVRRSGPLRSGNGTRARWHPNRMRRPQSCPSRAYWNLAAAAEHTARSSGSLRSAQTAAFRVFERNNRARGLGMSISMLKHCSEWSSGADYSSLARAPGAQILQLSFQNAALLISLLWLCLLWQQRPPWVAVVW